MNTAKHTPGPWHLSECATQTTKAGIVSMDGLHITDVYGYGMTDSQNQANAHLIAAAPAMYEALQIMVKAANVDEIDPLVMFASIERAKGALAQAEGEGILP